MAASSGGFHSAATAIRSSCRQAEAGRGRGLSQRRAVGRSAVSCPLAPVLPGAHTAPAGMAPSAGCCLLAWKTRGASQGEASSSTTAGCRQCTKWRRPHTAARVPAGGSGTHSCHGCRLCLGAAQRRARSASRGQQPAQGSNTAAQRVAQAVGSLAAWRRAGRQAPTCGAHNMQLLVPLAPQPHDQPAKARQAGSVAGESRAQAGACGGAREAGADEGRWGGGRPTSRRRGSAGSLRRLAASCQRRPLTRAQAVLQDQAGKALWHIEQVLRRRRPGRGGGGSGGGAACSRQAQQHGWPHAVARRGDEVRLGHAVARLARWRPRAALQVHSRGVARRCSRCCETRAMSRKCRQRRSAAKRHA